MDEPEFQFRGTFVPSDVLEEFWNGSISAVEIMFLITVDCYVTTENGCLAPIEQLAKETHIPKRKIYDFMDDLCKRGYLKIEEIDGNVEITPYWSRIDLPDGCK
jgi:DNA-binding IscR family transcriptional regulator